MSRRNMPPNTKINIFHNIFSPFRIYIYICLYQFIFMTLSPCTFAYCVDVSMISDKFFSINLGNLITRSISINCMKSKWPQLCQHSNTKKRSIHAVTVVMLAACWLVRMWTGFAVHSFFTDFCLRRDVFVCFWSELISEYFVETMHFFYNIGQTGQLCV